MKKYQRLFCRILVLITLICCVMVPIRANAQGETRTVNVDIYVQSDANVAKNEFVDVYFENTATGEVHKFTLKASGDSYPIVLPKGEYRVAKATLQARPEVAFNTSVGKLVVDDSANIYFTLALKSVIKTEENEEEVEDSIKDFKQEKKNKNLLAVGMLLWLALGITSLVYTLKGRRAKDALQADLFSAKAKITRHVFFGLMCGTILGYLIGDGGGFSMFGGIVGFGFPFGAVAVGVFAPKEDPSRDYDSERSSGGIYVLLLALALVVGVFLTPIVIIRDVVGLVKASRNCKNGIQ